MLRHIEEIEVGDRFRKSLGDIEGLAESIERVGLLHPLVVTPENRLVAGRRRLEAARHLGWTEVPVVVAADLDSGLKLLLAERDENTVRQDFTPGEAVALRRALEPLERKAAAGRQATLNNAETASETFSEAKGRALDKIAEAAGISRPTLEKATEVVEAAEKEPESFGPIVEQMNRTGNVNGAHKQAEALLNERVPGFLEAVETGDMEKARDLAREAKEKRRAATGKPVRQRRPAKEPPPPTVKQKALRLCGVITDLGNASITPGEFREHAPPASFEAVQCLVPAALRFLTALEVEQ